MWPNTLLSELLGIEHPIIQAPMAGSTTVELVAAASNAGGIGSMGYVETPLERIRQNDYIEFMAAHRLPLPDFPTMYALSNPLKESSSDSLDFRFLFYGQAAALNREMPAADLMQTLVEETQALI